MIRLSRQTLPKPQAKTPVVVEKPKPLAKPFGKPKGK